MRNLNDMNDLYNAQDVISLCEIIENRFQLMQNKCSFNPRKCNSASTLSGSMERDLSKIIIRLQTNNEHVKLFEKTLTGGFSCENLRLLFDTEILLPNVENRDKNNWKDYSYKDTYNLKLYEEEKYSTKRVISKILKLHEIDQYGFSMTKPMPTGSIKKKVPRWRVFKLLLETDLDDPIGHLFVVDMKVQAIYDKHKIEKCFLYQSLADTDSTSLFFVFICNLNCQLNEKDSRNMIFEIMINSKIFERLDWLQFDVRNTSKEKHVGLYKIESIYNPNIVTIAVNTKEYFKKYKDKSFNKKHKGLKKDTPGMHFEAYANRVMSLSDFTNQKTKKIQQNRFQIKNTEMRMQGISTSQFAGLNDKRFYFYDGIVSMPFGLPLLENLRKEKKKETHIHFHIKEKEE